MGHFLIIAEILAATVWLTREIRKSKAGNQSRIDKINQVDTDMKTRTENIKHALK